MKEDNTQQRILAVERFNNGEMDNTLEEELGKKRERVEPLEQRRFDIAFSMQNRIKEVIIHMVRNVAATTGHKKLALSGGLFLNCDINRELIQNSGYKDIFIPPFTSDTGGAAGAGLYAAFQYFNRAPEEVKSFSPYLVLNFNINHVISKERSD
jgi:predicted NodU family carbamoyl transferase